MTLAIQETDPVEILLNMAREGKINPWDIDLLKVTDEFLAELDRVDPKALARSARCLFYASALVHFKAQILNEGASAFAVVDEVPEWDDFDDFGDDDGRIEPPLFYPRRGVRLRPREKRPRGRSLTLDDLLDALRRLDARSLVEDPDEFDPWMDDSWDMTIDEEIPDIPTAHEDDVEGDILKVRDQLREMFKSGETRIDLNRLCDETMTRGEAYRAVLFMAADEELEIEQEELYGDLWVCPGEEPLREPTEEELARRETIEERQKVAREQREKKRRDIPGPGRKRGRKLSRRPGLGPAAGSRRPKAGRRPQRGFDGRRSSAPGRSAAGGGGRGGGT